MSDIAIKLENISKRYQLGMVGTNTLKGDLQAFWHKIQGKEDPTLKIGEENKLGEAGGNHVWALKGINLEVKQGEILGIIGKNGAGKSTLLKLLSQVTGPTTGSIKVNGRIASLLEVGTGFHPELTGKENIFLNGAILGMTKQEIKSKLNEIVNFAGVAKYLDTPVKRYSSGMYVRLAFAVAAHLEPDILVVDEVLAVGDAEFQKKAIGKMKEVSSEGERTVLFVSHNMGSIQRLCNRVVEVSQGTIIAAGDAETICKSYLNRQTDKITESKGVYTFPISKNNYDITFLTAKTLDLSHKVKPSFSSNEDIILRIEYKITKDIMGGVIVINIKNENLESIWTIADYDTHQELYKERKKGIWQFDIVVPNSTLSPGKYYVAMGAAAGDKYFHHPDPFLFEINKNGIWSISQKFHEGVSGKIILKTKVSKPQLLKSVDNE